MSTPFINCIERKEANNRHLDMQITQEKKKLLYSLCEVCNIQLNTAAQAKVHYNGKSHLKRVKQLNNGKLPAPRSAFASTSIVNDKYDDDGAGGGGDDDVNYFT
ncbi:UNVERIFIED_CONTAM: hypothetical protein FKN15_052899 [Acipenser sinensis]